MEPVASLDSILERADRFFMGESKLHRAASELARTMSELGLDFAIAGALALAAHGHERLTSDVDVLLTPEAHQKLKEAVLGRGYVEAFPGSRGLRDTVNGVKIDFVLTGDFPGDGRPKPVSFPHPRDVAMPSGRYPVVRLETLVELKLASGMSAPHRLQDLADVIALIRARRLDREFADRLHPWVRAKYDELWQVARQAPPDE